MQAVNDMVKHNRRKEDQETGQGLHLSKRLENDLCDFVRKMRQSQPKDLYAALISEIDKFLFTFVLQETGGNQVQAAELLGVHRNTLTKKIKAFKIKIEKSPKK